MKRLFLSASFGLMVAHVSIAQQNSNTFTWSGTHTFVATNDPPPVIDAVNFVVNNGAFFGVDLTLEQVLEFSTFPFTTTDTLNYTNKGILFGVPGFDFENFPASVGQAQPAANFVNQANGLGGGTIICSNIYGGNIFSPLSGVIGSEVPGLSTLKINATNIIDSGLITMDNAGLIDLRGDNLDLRRGQFTMTGALGSALYGIIDWGSGGFGTNSFFWQPSIDLTPTTATSAEFFSSLNFNFEQMILTNSSSYFQSNNSGTTIIWRGIFLQDSSPANVTKNVYFTPSLVGNGEFHIEWVGTVKDPVTSAISTNYFYLSDVPANRRSTNFNFGVSPDSQSQFFGEFTLSSSPVRQNLGAPAQVGFANPSPDGIVSNDFAYINAELSAAVVTNEVFGGSATNVPGRIQLSGAKSLNLANTRIIGPNYTLLSSPVNFQGNSNSFISTTFSDVRLGVPNNLLTISNLIDPNVIEWTGITNAPSGVFNEDFITPVPTPMGGIQAWSGSFLFTSTNGGVTITNDVRILMVNSAIQPTGPALQQDVQLHTGQDLVISDQLNIYRNFTSDAQVLTITTNGGGAFSSAGNINLLSPDIFWSTSLSNLEILTNFGGIESLNLTVFAGNLSSPFSDPNSATPYQAFINHGVITNQGTIIRAGTFENSGVIEDTLGGSMDIAVTSALATNGLFLAPGGFISIAADSLLASNGMIEAGGGPLTLTIPCSLSDGYVFGNQFGHITNSTLPNVVTNGNTWLTSGGVVIPVKPPTADLLGTTLTNLAFNNFDSINVWPGQDLGNTPQGFGDNLALGRMILNADSTSVFTFASATGNNALYVDSIELQGNTTNTDSAGNPLSVVIQPGMNIYYAQAIENGVSIAEKLNGKYGLTLTNGGQFFWISNYAGVYSSTNIHYPDGNTYIFNEALAISPDIASGGPDGSQTNLANINNPTPIPTNEVFDITITGPQLCAGGGNTNQQQGTNGVVVEFVRNKLSFPVEASNGGNGNGGNGGAGAVSFTLAQGAYNGLFYNTNGVDPATAGSFTAKVTSKGGYSAKLLLGSATYSFSGTFDSSGHASAAVAHKGLATVQVDMQLVNNDEITGSVSGNNWLSQLQADLAAFNSKNPAPWTGKQTLLLPTDTNNFTLLTGDGFGTLSISSSGAVQFTGTLPDGVKVTEKSALSKSGVWPVYSSLYGGTGSFIGWMQCVNGTNADLGGSGLWIAPAGSSSVHPGGLTNQLDPTGSRVLGKFGFSKGAAILSGGAINSSVTNGVIVIGNVVHGSDSTWKLSANPQTGLFNGSVVDPNSGQKLLFHGALLERSGTGGGFFLNADQSGKVYLGTAN